MTQDRYAEKARIALESTKGCVDCGYCKYDIAEIVKAMREVAAEAWEEAARFGIEWMKNPGGVDARFIAALREQGQALREQGEKP